MPKLKSNPMIVLNNASESTNLELFAGDYSVVNLGELDDVLSLPALPLRPTFDTLCNLTELIPFVEKSP